jgi:hypothetical protein
MNLDNVINGENFKNLAHLIVDESNISDKIEYGDKKIVFCKSNAIPFFFNEIIKFDTQIILITHQSDYEVTDKIPKIRVEKTFVDGKMEEFTLLEIGKESPLYYRLKPKQIKKWFAVNTDCKFSDLITLPCGILNHKGPAMLDSVDFSYLESLPDSNIDQLNNQTDKILDKIYVNFTETHFNRKMCRNFFIKSGIGYIETENLKLEEYLRKINNFLFVACPRGNGIDTHRVWETLLMGSIPIVEKHSIYDNFDLPILQVESWVELLDKKKLQPWIDKYESGELFQDISKLHMTYWKNLIFSEYNKLN